MLLVAFPLYTVVKVHAIERFVTKETIPLKITPELREELLLEINRAGD